MNSMIPDEATIIARIQAGETEEFGVLYDAFIEQIYRFIYYKTHQKEVAEDLTSIVFMKALEKIHKYSQAKGSFHTWLYQIARHTIIDHYRAQKITITIDDAWDIPSGTDMARDVAVHLDFEELQKYLGQLSTTQRDVIVMKLWEGLSFEEIAQILEATEGSCKMQMKRGIEKLQKIMPLTLFLSFLYQKII